MDAMRIRKALRSCWDSIPRYNGTSWRFFAVSFPVSGILLLMAGVCSFSYRL